MIKITAIHLVGGRTHEHIERLRWQGVESGDTGDISRQGLVDWLDNKQKTNRALVGDYPKDYVWVGTVHPNYAPAYVRTYADGVWTDNLLSLPEY